jgi:hypothetical protein
MIDLLPIMTIKNIYSLCGIDSNIVSNITIKI